MLRDLSHNYVNFFPILVSYIKSLDIWMITCMVYVFAALLEFSIVYHVHYRRAKSKMQSLVSTTNGQSQVMAVGHFAESYFAQGLYKYIYIL